LLYTRANKAVQLMQMIVCEACFSFTQSRLASLARFLLAIGQPSLPQGMRVTICYRDIFLTALDIIKHQFDGRSMNFKRQSPVTTTDSPAVKCKRLHPDFRVATKKRDCNRTHVKTRMHIGRTLHVVTQCLLTLLTLTI